MYVHLCRFHSHHKFTSCLMWSFLSECGVLWSTLFLLYKNTPCIAFYSEFELARKQHMTPVTFHLTLMFRSPCFRDSTPCCNQIYISHSSKCIEVILVEHMPDCLVSRPVPIVKIHCILRCLSLCFLFTWAVNIRYRSSFALV